MNEELPYYQIPDYPESYTACNVAARMIDGLGFRYYWVTEGLRDEDLNYKPGDGAKSTDETLDHLLDLSWMIVNSTIHQSNGIRDKEGFSFETKRKQTLENLKKAADILRDSDDLSEYTLVFERNGKTSKFPFWNNINGPIADALWHCGQIVSFRRASGNPFDSRASLFSGKLRE